MMTSDLLDLLKTGAWHNYWHDSHYNCARCLDNTSRHRYHAKRIKQNIHELNDYSKFSAFSKCHL